MVVPNAFDGMAAFPLPNGNVRLIRNHEMGDSADVGIPVGDPHYDGRASGGTTSLEVRISVQDGELAVELVDEFVSLAGTIVNCAGGPTPWGSWLSCEETLYGPESGYEKPHGYVFEVPVHATGPVDPVPLRAMGRFVHEAVAVDPATGIVYQTEDRWENEAGFYRFIPDTPGVLSDGGRLQMIAVTEQPRYVTSQGQTQGAVWPVHWVDIADPDQAVSPSGFRGGRGAIRAARRRFPRRRRNLLRVDERRRRACGAGVPLPAHFGRGRRVEAGLRVALAGHPGQPRQHRVEPARRVVVVRRRERRPVHPGARPEGTDREPRPGWKSRVRGLVLQRGRPGAVLQRAGLPATGRTHGERHLRALETAGRREPEPADLTHRFPARPAGAADAKRARTGGRPQ